MKKNCKCKGEEVSPNTNVFRCLKPLDVECKDGTMFGGSRLHVEPKPDVNKVIKALEHEDD
jgi:hypothetical protein